ncbi:MAG: phosphoribosylglycinamide formyltransferase [Chloroflexota bacterium]
MNSPGIGVLASGDGSNLQSLLDACSAGTLDAHVSVVVSHNARARALDRARAAGVTDYAVLPPRRRDDEDRRRMEKQVLDLLARHEPDLLVLAGWMFVLSQRFLTRCRVPLLNVHPALLPLRGGDLAMPDPCIEGLPSMDRPMPVLRGAHAVRDAITQRLPYTGVSVHHVAAEVDAGAVISREVVTIEETDDEESLYRRIKRVEHRLLVDAVRSVLSAVPGGAYA